MLAFFLGFCASAGAESDSPEPNETIPIDPTSSPSPSVVAPLLFWGRIFGSMACAAVVMVVLGAIWLCCNRVSDDERYRAVDDDDEADKGVKLEDIGPPL
jgi:hypothetical protein